MNTRIIVILLLSGFLLSCGSGSGGGGGENATSQITQIRGVVVAPGGAIARSSSPSLLRWFASLVGFPDEVAAQATNLTPAQNARVFLLNVDITGKPIGPPLAVTTTDVNGAFVFNLSPKTDLSPTTSTLTVIQAAPGNASAPVAIGTAGTLNAPAVQSVVLVDPASELAIRRIITAGIGNFATTSGKSSVAGYVGLIQALLEQVPSLAGTSIATTISNIQNHFAFQNEVLPVLTDIEQSTHVDQSLFSGTYSFFEYHTYADSDTTPFHRTTEHGELTFNHLVGTVDVNSNEFGGTLKETCITVCTRTFLLQFFQDTTTGQGLFFRTATNRLIFSAPGAVSFVSHTNPTGTVGIFSLKSSDGEQSLGILMKKGSNISGADFATAFNYVDFGSVLNMTSVNHPTTSGTTWTGILQSRSGTGTVTFGGSNSPVGVNGVSGVDSPMSQLVTCTPSGAGCTISAGLGLTGAGVGVALPFTVTSEGTMVLTGIGSGAMSSDRALYAATQTDPLRPADTLLSIVVRQPTGMTAVNLIGTYRIVTLEDNLMTTGQITTRLLAGAAQLNGLSSASFTTMASQVDRVEGCPAGACNIATTITGTSPPVSETHSYAVTTNGVLSFTGGNIPLGATVNGAVSPDASFFVVQTVTSNVAGTSTRAITLGVKTP